MNEIELDGYINDNLGWKFLCLFTLYVGIFVGLAQILQPLFQKLMHITAAATAEFWSSLSVPATCYGTNLTLMGFSMEIVLECTALHYSVIFVAAILAFSRHSIRYRAVGIAGGLAAIFVLNIVRLGVLGIIGRYDKEIFEFVHLYLWQGIFAISVLMLWVVWINGISGRYGVIRRYLVEGLVAVTIIFWVFISCIDEYISFVAALSGPVLRIFSAVISVPDRIFSDSRLIGYIYGGDVIYSDVGLYALNLTVFLAIAVVSALHTGKTVRWKRLAFGTVLMTISHIAIVVMDWSLELSGNVLLVWCIVLSSILAPFVALISATTVFRAGVPKEGRG